MKNQYFGDVRDLFKYDLIQRVLQEITPQRLFLIPMLTENDSSTEGKKRDFDGAEKASRPGTKNKRLINFLNEKCKVDVDKRDFTEIKTYFESEDIRGVDIYKGHEYFNHGRRDEYFGNIPENSLCNSLVFVDPDIGLQIKKSTKKHLLYQEVKALYGRMDKDSILMIYQHFPRTHCEEYLPKGRLNKLEEETGDLPLCISDKEIFFLFLTRNGKVREQLKRVISKYESDYPERITIP